MNAIKAISSMPYDFALLPPILKHSSAYSCIPCPCTLALKWVPSTISNSSSVFDFSLLSLIKLQENVTYNAYKSLCDWALIFCIYVSMYCKMWLDIHILQYIDTSKCGIFLLSTPGSMTTQTAPYNSLRKKYTSGPRYWNVPVLVNTGTFLVYQYCLKMWYLRYLERAGVIQKLTILERKNGLVLSNTRVPVSGTWSILFPSLQSILPSFLHTIIQDLSSIHRAWSSSWTIWLERRYRVLVMDLTCSYFLSPLSLAQKYLLKKPRYM